MKKLLFPILMLSLLAGFTACNKDDDHDHDVTISILEPSNGEVITDASLVHIHIEVEAEDEVHEMEVILHPHGDVDNKIIDFDTHSHESSVTFEQDVDLSSFPSGTEFHLEVVVCKDHDCEEKEEEDISFSIQ